MRVRVLLPALDAVEGEGLTGVTTTLAVAMKKLLKKRPSVKYDRKQ